MKARSKILAAASLTLLSPFLSFCGGGGEDDGDDFGSRGDIDVDSIAADGWGVENWAYQLQGAGDLEELVDSSYELFVIDYSRDGGEEGAYTQGDLKRLKESGVGRKKIALSYLSIGEAEDYRYYWRESWKNSPPDWLAEENPEWKGNYKVRYWMKGWKEIIYGGKDSYLDKIIEAGFDGVYLDIIDAYYYWEERGRESAFDEMVAFVIEIANYARKTKGKGGFIVVPQNAPELLEDGEYLKVVSGLGAEDTWFDDNEPQDSEHTSYVLPFMRQLKQAGKPVLVIDYVTEATAKSAFCEKATKEGFVPYFSERELDNLTPCCPCK